MEHDRDSSSARSGIAWREAPGWKGVPWSLWLICGAVVIITLADFLRWASFVDLFQRMDDVGLTHDAIAEREAITRRWRLTFQLYLCVATVCCATLTYAVARLASAPVERGARILGWMTCAVFALITVWYGLRTFVAFEDGYRDLAKVLRSADAQAVYFVIYGAGLGCILRMFARVSAAAGRPEGDALAPWAWLGIAWEVVFPLVMLLFEPEFKMREESPWTFFLITKGPSTVALMLIAAIALRLRRTLDGPHSQAIRESSPSDALP